MGRRWLLGLAAATGLMVSVSGQAVAAAQSTQPVDVNSFAGAYLAGRVAEVDNNLSDAIVYYKKALSFAPDNDALRQSLMLALLSEGRFDEAVPHAERLKSSPEVERLAGLTLAIDSFRKKDFKLAETQLTFAEESDLDALISSVVVAWAKLGAGDKQGAIAKINELSGPDWYGLFVSYSKALIAEQAGDNDVADRAYRAALDDVANGGAAPDAWLRTAESYAGFLARQGKKDAALAVLEKADEFAPGRLPIVSLRDRIMKGEPVARMVAMPSDGASEHLMVLASALNRGGGEPFVRLYLQLALALRPDSDQALIQLAGVAEQQQDSQRAIELYERVPASSPLKRVSQLQLGLNLADLERRDEAIAELRKLVDQNPDDMRGYLALGGVYASKEDYAEAAKTYDKAVEHLESKKFTMPGDQRGNANWNIYYQRGIAYERLKQWPKAEPNFKKALELFPNQPQVMNYLGYSWIDMDINLKEGMDLIAKAVELRPSDGYIVDSLGWAHYRLGEYDEAVRELERAVSLMPNDPVLNDHLGDAYWRVGRKLEATFQWSHARDMKPEPAVLAEVEKKLKEGLPPVDDKAIAGQPEVVPTPPAVDPEPAKPEQRSDAGPETAPVATIEPASYKVSRGQSLWSIAADELGNGSRYIEILNLNPQLRGDPGRLVPGQELKLPPAGN
ncbi:tetratricopeptide repeat protein [Mesorhizobium sp. VNQ89]|uniref:tetratricopeptide repeat protein n=1 Tax=Mesorhizobium quangtriensis TaxID=3157709 RepID=UPI0032B8404A